MKKYKTIPEALRENALANPGRMAVYAEGQQMSYALLYETVCGFAKYLLRTGIKRGDCVVMQTRQSLDFVIAYLGTQMAGSVFVPIAKKSSAEELDTFVLMTQAFLLISEKESRSTTWLDANTIRETADAHKNDAIDIVYPEPKDAAELLFSSGTTGKAKGVLLSQANVTAVAENMIVATGYHEKTLVAVPNLMNHGHGLRKISAAIYNGSGLAIIDGIINIGGFFKVLDELPVTGICLPASMVHAMLVLSADTIGNYADKIEFIESSSAALPEEEKEKLCRLLPQSRLYNVYGMAEAGTLCIYDYNQIKNKDNCVGMVTVNSEITIVDEERNPIGSSRENTGLLVASGPIVMMRYWGDPELTAESIHDGCFYTTDVGYIEDGMVYLTGRTNDMINIGGLKVAPAEIEDAAMQCTGVSDCACVAVPDQHKGQAPKLFVVPTDGARIDAELIKTELRKILAPYKLPKYIETIDSIPRSNLGKKLRSKLP